MKKILSLFKHLFRKTHTFPIDQLITLTGEENVAIWNGVNYCREFMFKDPNDKSNAWGDAKKTPWLQIAFGRYVSGYGDWGGGFDRCCEPMVKIRIDEHLAIRDIIRESPFSGTSIDAKKEKKVNSCLSHIKVGDALMTENTKLVEWISNIFKVPEDVRYAHCAFIGGVLNKSWEREKWQFEKDYGIRL